MFRRPSVALALVVAVVAAGCSSDDGRELPPAGPDQTRSILTTSTAAPSSTASDLAVEIDDSSRLTTNPTLELALTLPWGDDAPIPVRHSCDGENLSPPVSWTNVPEGTVEIALVLSDVDAGAFHWVVTGLDPAAGAVPEGALPELAAAATNSFGTAGYSGPCGAESHSYLLEIFAVGQQLEVAAGDPAADVVAAIESVLIAQRSVAGRYP